MVTAVYNGEAYLEDTIRSLVYQGYPNLEYIIVNDGSTDRTAEIIRDYERYLTAWINQTNQGLYAALNTGFARSTGEVMGWLNCSDKLHTGGLAVVGSVFATFPEIEWITGRPTGFNTLGMTTHIDNLKRWSRYPLFSRREPVHPAGVYLLEKKSLGARWGPGRFILQGCGRF